jgi:pimeloyl-ACP methyl ester carboxylesterase
MPGIFRSEFRTLRGLNHHILHWEPETPDSPMLLFLHGFADAAGSWEQLAPYMIEAGYHIIAPDFRGFGRSEHVGSGGYYHFPDYLSDLDELMDQLSPTATFGLVGHSMGGTVASMLAGVRPKRFHHVALLEGVGPFNHEFSDAPFRVEAWLDSLRSYRTPQTKKTFTSQETMLERLSKQHPYVERTVLHQCMQHLIIENPDKTWSWAYDPLHRTPAPFPFFSELYQSYAKKIACPTLFVSGGKDGFHPPDEHQRLQAFRYLTSLEMPDAGHMMHWTQPEKLSQILLSFLVTPPVKIV